MMCNICFMINDNHLQVCDGIMYTKVIISQLCVLLTTFTNKKKKNLKYLLLSIIKVKCNLSFFFIELSINV